MPTWRTSLKQLTAEVLYRSGIIERLAFKNPIAWKILTYHRVVEPNTLDFPTQPGMYVRPSTFRMQMQLLRQRANVISLESLVTALLAGQAIAPKTVIVTFDDGWKDNFEHAFPILKELSIPASICLATSYIGERKLFWSDEIVALFSLGRGISNQEKFFKDHFKFLPDILINKCLVLIKNVDPTNADSLIEEMKKLPSKTREKFIKELKAALGRDSIVADSSTGFMSWEDVKAMSAAGVRFLSHSHSHKVMSEMSYEEASSEVQDSVNKCQLHQVPLLPIFCYPGGYFGPESQKSLDAANIKFALGTARKSQLRSTPPILGRISIHEDVSNTPARFLSRIWAPGF